MKPQTLRLLALCSTGFVAIAHARSAAAASPQSLTGDWEYVISPPLKLVLHLQVDASGTLSGSVDTPDTPPQHIELTNVHLAGNMLNYSMGSQPGTYHEVISADASKMLGPHMWVRTGRSPAGGNATTAAAETDCGRLGGSCVWRRCMAHGAAAASGLGRDTDGNHRRARTDVGKGAAE
jgi:hypothetical protein